MKQEILLATRWKRLGGALIDSLTLMVIIIPIMLVTGVLQNASNGRPMTFGQQVLFVVIGLVIFTLLHGYLLYSRGQTIGKVVVKTKIVDLEGNKPDIGKLLGLRYYIFSILSLIPLVGNFVGLIDALFIFRQDRRCLHDLLAGTQVIDVSG